MAVWKVWEKDDLSVKLLLRLLCPFLASTFFPERGGHNQWAFLLVLLLRIPLSLVFVVSCSGRFHHSRRGVRSVLVGLEFFRVPRRFRRR